MIRQWLLPGLLDTGLIGESLWAIRDGLVNLFVMRGSDGLICLDAGWRPSVIRREFAKVGMELGDVRAVFLTHWHWDHARGARSFTNATVYAGAHDAARIHHAQGICDGQLITAAGLRVQVVGTPGHTPGSVSYVVDNRFLFTGDLLGLRKGKIVPYWLAHDRNQMRESISKIAANVSLEGILTGHNGMTGRISEAFG